MDIEIIEHPFFGGWVIQDSEGNRLCDILFNCQEAAQDYADNFID